MSGKSKKECIFQTKNHYFCMSMCTKKDTTKEGSLTLFLHFFSLFPGCWRLNLTPFRPPFQAVSSGVAHTEPGICRLARETCPGLVSRLKHVLGARQSIPIMVLFPFPFSRCSLPKELPADLQEDPVPPLPGLRPRLHPPLRPGHCDGCRGPRQHLLQTLLLLRHGDEPHRPQGAGALGKCHCVLATPRSPQEVDHLSQNTAMPLH